MSLINGTPVNFGFTDTNGIALGLGPAGATFAGLLLQSADESIDSEREDIRDGIGNIVIRSYYDFHGKATLEFVITGATIAASVTNTTLAPFSPGQFLNVTASSTMKDLAGISGGTAGGSHLGSGGAPGTMSGASSIWEIVGGASIKKSNTGAARISIPLEYRSNIQGVAAP